MAFSPITTVCHFKYAYQFVKQIDYLPSFVCTYSNSCLVLGSRGGVKSYFLYVWTAPSCFEMYMMPDICVLFIGGGVGVENKNINVLNDSMVF